jgi:methylthioxylose transferase
LGDTTNPELKQTKTQPHVLALGLGLALTLLVVLALRLRLLPLGIPGQWQWLYREVPIPFGPGAALALVTCLLAAALTGWLLTRPQPLARYQIALALIVTTLACWVSLAGLLLDRPMAPVEVPAISVSTTAMGYYGYGKAAPDLHSAFRFFSGLPVSELPPAPGRVATHPPGPFLFFYFGRQLLEAWPAPVEWLGNMLQRTWGLTPEMLHGAARYYMMPNIQPGDMVPAALLALIISFLGALLPLPAYLLGRELLGAREGLVAALLAATVPSLISFTPSIDGVAALLACLAMALSVRAIGRGTWGAAVVAGLALTVAVFWTAGVGAIVIAIAVVALLFKPKNEPGEVAHRLSPIFSAAIIFGTTAIIFAVLKLTVDYNVIGNLLKISLQQRVEMIGRREYLPWLPMNLYDFALFMGPFLITLVLAGISHVRRMPLLRSYLAGLAVTLLLILLSGSTRGEVGRIWLFLMPLCGVAAVPMLTSVPRRETVMALMLTTLCQFGMGLTLAACLALVQL